MIRRAVPAALSLALLLCACGGEPPEPAPPRPAAQPAPPQRTEPAPPTQPARAGAAEVTARVRIVDLDGAPLPEMGPIACLAPNAFEEPLARGRLSNSQGRSEITFPAGQTVHLRGWDPAGKYFANNLRTYVGGGAPVSGELELVMVRGVQLRAVFATPAREPLANDTVGVMMHHPTKGPWWPAQTMTDGNGAADFGTVPAGLFVLEFRTPGGLRLELPETPLRPGAQIDLGLVVLQ
jgi:hypothetical protein